MMNEVQCQRHIDLMREALQKARSDTVEIYEQMVTIDLDPAQCRDAAARIEPWLFSEECDEWIIRLAEWKHPTPIDVMNVTVAMNLKQRFKYDPLAPGDSIALKICRVDRTDRTIFKDFPWLPLV